MEKYLKDLGEDSVAFDTNNNLDRDPAQSNFKPELSKWIESAANFTPSKNTYIEWCAR